MKKFFYPLVFLLPLFVKAQSRDSIFLLKKEYVIKQVEEYFQKSYPKFSAASFDRINLSKSNKNRYRLSFSNSIVYIPKGEAYYGSATYTFILDSLFRLNFAASTCKEETSDYILKPTQFYHPSSKDKRTIKYIFRTLKKDGHNHPKYIVSPDQYLVILEMKDVYEVHFNDEWGLGVETVHKLDSKVEAKGHKDYALHEKEEQWKKLEW